MAGTAVLGLLVGAEAGESGHLEDDVGTVVVGSRGQLPAGGGIVEGAHPRHGHLSRGVHRRHALLEPAQEAHRRGDLDAADVGELVGLGRHAGDDAREVCGLVLGVQHALHVGQRFARVEAAGAVGDCVDEHEVGVGVGFGDLLDGVGDEEAHAHGEVCAGVDRLLEVGHVLGLLARLDHVAGAAEFGGGLGDAGPGEVVEALVAETGLVGDHHPAEAGHVHAGTARQERVGPKVGAVDRGADHARVEHPTGDAAPHGAVHGAEAELLGGVADDQVLHDLVGGLADADLEVGPDLVDVGDDRTRVVEERLEAGLGRLGKGSNDVGVCRGVRVGGEQRGGVGGEPEGGGSQHRRVGAGQPGEVGAGRGHRLDTPSLVLAPGGQVAVEGDLLNLEAVLPLENLPEDLAGEDLHLGKTVQTADSRGGVHHETERRLLIGGEERDQVGSPGRCEHNVLREGHAEGDVAGHDVVGGADAGTARADLDVKVALLEEAEKVGGVERGVVGRGEPVGLYRHRGHLRQHRHGGALGGLFGGRLGLLGGCLGGRGSRLGGRSGLLRGRELCFELGHFLVGGGRVGGGRLQSGRSLSRRGCRGVGLGPCGVGLGPGGVSIGLSSLDGGGVYHRGGGGGGVVSVVAAGGCDEGKHCQQRQERSHGIEGSAVGVSHGPEFSSVGMSAGRPSLADCGRR